ncbi:MAG: hypothetical protein ACC653_11920 [Gammaproteobacteria bacterium]
MNKIIVTSLTLFSMIVTLPACSENSDDNAPKNDRIWKTQTDALKQADDLAEQLNNEFKRKEKQMQEAQQ